jgi:hypothetical protein
MIPIPQWPGLHALARAAWVVATLAVVPAVCALDLKSAEGIWLFDDGSGDKARDSSDKGRDGKIGGGAKWAAGKIGRALDFDGSPAAGVTIADYKGVGGANPRTTLLWWKGNTARDHSWVKWGVNADTKKYYVRAHTAAPKCFLRVETQGGQHYGSTDVCDGNWHYLAVVFPPGGKSVKDHLLYVDGKLETTTAGNPVGVDTDVATQDVVFGYPLAHHVNAAGTMDEVAIFSAALTEAEIRDIMSHGLVRALSVNPAGKAALTWGRLKAAR